MKRLGKVGKEWLQVRRQWLKDHPPSHQGYHICSNCARWIPANEITVDHIRPRSERPDLRFDVDNLQLMCWSCNQAKGSKHMVQSIG